MTLAETMTDCILIQLARVVTFCSSDSSKPNKIVAKYYSTSFRSTGATDARFEVLVSKPSLLSSDALDSMVGGPGHRPAARWSLIMRDNFIIYVLSIRFRQLEFYQRCHRAVERGNEFDRKRTVDWSLSIVDRKGPARDDDARCDATRTLHTHALLVLEWQDGKKQAGDPARAKKGLLLAISMHRRIQTKVRE